jgi:thiol-disulfide isomerase/thioredoxin
MKTKQKMAAAAIFLLLLAGCANNRGVVENPAFVAQNSSALKIDKVEVGNASTILHISAFYDPGNWIKIDPKSVLIDDKGTQYVIQSADGIVLGEEFYMPESGKTAFRLTFPAVARRATFVDFSEGDFDGAFKIWGIQLTDKPLKTYLPEGFKNSAPDQTAELPPVKQEMGKAMLRGQILGYRAGMPDEVSVRVSYPFAYPPEEITLPVDEKGVFFSEIEVFSTHPAWVRWTGEPAYCYLAAGETTTVILNPIGENKPELQMDPAYFGGYLASLSKELAGRQSMVSLKFREDYDAYYAFLESIENATPEMVKTRFLNEYREKKAALDTLQASPAAKQVLRCMVDMACSSDVYNTLMWLEIAAENKGQQEAALKLPTLPADFYDDLKDFAAINDPAILYVMDLGGQAQQMQLGHAQPLLARVLGTDQGPLFDAMKAAEAYTSIENFEPLSAAQLDQLPVLYRGFFQNKNNELLELMKANEGKTGYSVHSIEDLSPDAVLPFIIKKFKGKPILIDVWATWCGPCRLANEELKPVKEELAASGKDLVYVFIAGENSPLGTWNNMIPDLHGEHFRLSEAQWNYLGQHYDLSAVPTYFFIDRKGQIKEKQAGYPGLEKMKQKIHQLVND